MSKGNGLSDRELMLRVREGDIGRLGMLFERHHLRLFNFFLRVAGNRQVAEDLVQEVFVRMLKYRHTFRGDAGFAPWMYRLARNVRADHFRRRGREPVAEVEAEALELASDEPLPSALAERAESLELLESALGRLPVERRELLVMSRFQLLQHAEIAELLGCTVGAVKVRVHRAVKQLGEIYQQLASEVTS